MIKLSNSATMLICPDGSQVEFEVDELQAGILRSCLAAGSHELWIAEDIALSIEYAMMLPANRGRTFTVSEINSLVVRVLEETGYPEIAEAYRRQHSTVGVKVSPDYPLIAELVSRHLGLSGNNLVQVAERVVAAAAKLNIETATPLLFVELAKLYKEELLAEHDAELVALPARPAPLPWLIARTEIAESLSAATRELLQAGIFDFTGVSRMFPAFKLELRITRLVRHYQLVTPLTEMAVIAHWGPLAAAFNEANGIVARLAAAHPEGPAAMPVYLAVNDMSAFACTHLLSRWPDAESCCREMLAYLEEMLDFKFFKITLK